MYCFIDIKKNGRIIILTAVFLVAIIIFGICLCLLEVTEYSAFPKNVYGVPVHTRLVAEAARKRPMKKRKIKYIVIHETGNPDTGANAAAHGSYIQTPNNETTSWHYTVDEKEIYHHIPDNEVAWHASDGLRFNGGNLNGIGIELCVNADGDFEKTFVNGAKLTAYLIKEYGLSVKAVKQHADFAKKNCPATIRNQNRMGEFITLVEYFMKS